MVNGLAPNDLNAESNAPKCRPTLRSIAKTSDLNDLALAEPLAGDRAKVGCNTSLAGMRRHFGLYDIHALPRWLLMKRGIQVGHSEVRLVV